AIATLLDLVFKPGIQIRILGGSLEQSSRMFEALTSMFDAWAGVSGIAPRITGRSIVLGNGSRVEILSQSERSVRGQRVHKLRCDEVDLFDEPVWTAAQLTTRSGRCGGFDVGGAIEAFSTMHTPGGLMQRLVDSASRDGRRIFRWNVIDTLELCPLTRPCAGCALEHDCRGRARGGTGFVTIDDALQLRARVDDDTWNVEMIGDRPDARDLVFPSFDRTRHQQDMGHAVREVTAAALAGASDEGLAALLFLVEDARLVIVDEVFEPTGGLDALARQARQRGWRWPVADVVVDTGMLRTADRDGRPIVSTLREIECSVQCCRVDDDMAIAAMRRRLRAHEPELMIDTRCELAVDAMSHWSHRARRQDSRTVPILRALLLAVTACRRRSLLTRTY
ncbi:MAG: hypothetical protein KC983_07905, partial [Phycisphaerales bacterium]|nr:hypothetical protein [Phycisphaerales bacterium]